MDFTASAEHHTTTTRGPLQGPHTASGADEGGEHLRQRVLAVKLDLREDEALFKRLRDLSWQAARYRNLHLRALWAEAKNLKVDPSKNIPHDVTKWIRADEKGELSGVAYSAAEREVKAAWARHGSRILAGGPLPEWKPGSALSIRGHRNRNESGVRLEVDGDGRFVALLQAQSSKCEGGCWLRIPIAAGTVRDHQAEMLAKMANSEVAISKATITIKPFFHKVILRLSYALPFVLPAFGNRRATIGPITRGHGLFLRTECETRDYSAKLHTLLERKDQWDAIRRRAMAQIGRHKGAARAKRKLMAKMTWEDWLSTYLHQWSAEIIGWLHGQGISSLSVVGFENADWPAFKFTQMLTYKGEARGIAVGGEVDLAESASERAVKSEIGKQRRKASKAANAIRELKNQFGDQNGPADNASA